MQETQETWVLSLCLEDLLEEEMATHSSISCLENPTDRGAWQAIVHGVTKSQTQLKRLGTHSTIKLTMNVFRISPAFTYTAFYWRGGGV